jgi:hypothetical protein
VEVRLWHEFGRYVTLSRAGLEPSTFSLVLTPKAFANFSPGLRFGNPGFIAPDSRRNPERVAWKAGWLKSRRNSFKVVKKFIDDIPYPGFQSKHFHPTRAARVGAPAWAEISEHLRRTYLTIDFKLNQFARKIDIA